MKKVIDDKKRSKSKVAFTKDPFVKFVRRFVEDARPYSQVIMLRGKKGEGRCFTDGGLLISEVSKRPDVYRFMSIETLQVRKPVDEQYSNIERVIPKGEPEFRVSIPEDFYAYAKAFKIPHGCHRDSVYADITEGGITVEQSYSDDITMVYGEADVSGVTRQVRVNMRYLMALKPKVLEVYKKSYRIRGSYDKLVNAFSVIVLSAMEID